MRGAEEQVETNRSEPRPLALPGGLSRRRLLSFSPKLGRRVILANYTQRQLWLALEANPRVQRFCERPRHLDGKQGRLIDFWVRHSGGQEEYWVVADDNDDLPTKLQGVELRQIRAEQLRDWATPVANWAYVVAQLTTWRGWRNALLEQQVMVLLGVAMAMEDVCGCLREYSAEEVEAAVFQLLAQGKVICPELTRSPLGGRTVFERA